MSKQLWHRREKESAESYSALVIYYEMPYTQKEERTYAKVAETMGLSEARIKQMGVQWQWQERTRAYDDMMQAKREQTVARVYRDEILKMAENHRAIAQTILMTVYKKLNSMTDAEISAMSLTELGRLFEISVKVEREAIGQPGAIVEEVQSQGKDKGKVVEMQAELEAWWKQQEQLKTSANDKD